MGDIRPYQPPAVRPRILVVDDSGSVRDHLTRLLAQEPLMAEVEQAQDGAAGLRAVSEADYDCVICDLEMPILDGRKFLAAIRQKRAPDELPVLILTVRAETEEKVERFEGGASDFMVKPWDDQELVARVVSQIRLARVSRLQKEAGSLDALTGVGNRQWIVGRVDAELNRAQRAGHKIAVIIVDIEGFTQFNEEQGRDKGDELLISVAQTIKRGFRRYDVVARIGADEFAILLPDADVRVARFVADRLKERIAAVQDPFDIQLSAGCTAGPVSDDDDAEALLARAIEALGGDW